MMKFSVALLLVALVLSASARPQRLATRALKHARTAHNALKRNSIFERDTPVIAKQTNNVDFLEDKSDDDDSELNKILEQGLKKFEVEIMKALVQGLEEFIISTVGTEHGPQIREIFKKYPEPDYSNEDSVDHYLESVAKDIKEYAQSKGMSDPFGSSEEEDLSSNEV